MALFRRGGKTRPLAALASAQTVLEDELRLRSAGVAGICFKPAGADKYLEAEQKLEELIVQVSQEAGTTIRRRNDSFGYEWLVVRERDLARLADSVGITADRLDKAGYGSRLLAALFRFADRDQPVFLVYGFKTGTFWPFIPAGDEQERLNDDEIVMGRELKGVLPVEPRLERWLALYDAPVDE
jgi:hypothetical protein